MFDTNLKPIWIITIGGAIVFGLPTAVGLIVGHFFDLWLGIAVGVLIFVLVIFVAHRQLIKRAEQQEREDRGDNG